MPTKDGLRRLINGLNDDGLGICRPDPQLSPSRRRALRLTADEERTDAIYHKIRFLHFSDGKHLDNCIALFRTESRKLWKPARPALQDCLLKILEMQRAPSKSQAKRPSEELSQPQAEAKRSRGSGKYRVDSLPVRSRASQSGLQSPATDSPGSGHTILSYFRPSTTAAQSTETSFASKVFSPAADAGASSESTVDTDYDATQELYPPCTQEYQALEESFAQCDTPDPASEPPPPCKTAEPQALEERLKNIWRE